VSLDITSLLFFYKKLVKMLFSCFKSQSTAGVTFLAFGNGAPDIFR
jgi:Ca2+/Na+ antiporter